MAGLHPHACVYLYKCEPKKGDFSFQSVFCTRESHRGDCSPCWAQSSNAALTRPQNASLLFPTFRTYRKSLHAECWPSWWCCHGNRPSAPGVRVSCEPKQSAIWIRRLRNPWKTLEPVSFYSFCTALVQNISGELVCVVLWAPSCLWVYPRREAMPEAFWMWRCVSRKICHGTDFQERDVQVRGRARPSAGL